MTAIAVTIAGSDSSGGAGIQADLKTFSALGVYGASVIAALTAQNTKGVTAVHRVPADFVAAQMDAVFSDLAVGAVKIGMLGNADVIAAVAAGLDRYGQTNVVLDPVMVATSGRRLLAAEAVDVLRNALLPRALVVTPNLPEAAVLLDGEEATDAARALEGAGEVETPIVVMDGGGTAGGKNGLLDEVPAVVDVAVLGGGRGLADAAVAVVVGVENS
jgi:hydroxymethylpyrimidine/phosphomethylpyrimidine kinase